MTLDPKSIAAFEQARQSPGRPQKAATHDALARELLGESNNSVSPRTLARIRQNLSRYTQSELAESLQKANDPELAALGRRALSAPTYLEQKRAQKALSDIHAGWVASRFPRGQRPNRVTLRDNATTSSTAASARQALRDHNEDLAFRLILDHLASLAQRTPDEISLLMTRPKNTGDAALDALLHAGIAWAASSRDVPMPAWHQTRRLPELWNPTGRTVALEKALPEFLAANIFLEARDVASA